MRTALKNYLALANGLAEAGRDKALGVSQSVVMQGLSTVSKVTAVADDVRRQATQNREAVTSLVKFEATRALGRVGLVAAGEVTALQARVRALESTVREQQAAAAEPAAPSTAAPRKRAVAKPASAETLLP